MQSKIAPPTAVIACATVIEEMRYLMPPGMKYRALEFGLHAYPDRLRITLQATIDEIVRERAGERDGLTVLLGYGLCSQALVGIEARGCTLVAPRVDDCIAIFLGSRAAHQQQVETDPGTYYLTKGWVESGETPVSEFSRIAERFGEERAERLLKTMLANYTRVVLINTGQYEMERFRAYARNMAGRFQLRYEEISGSTALLRKMLDRTWDDEFIVVKPGETITLDHFLLLR